MSSNSRYQKVLAQRVAGIKNANAVDRCQVIPLQGAKPFIQHKIARHEANTKGRDFVVGDLHGCVGYLDTLMRHVGFDESTDRLFSVGDLVDRGPDSPGALELLKAPWFYPVLGNHDAMLLAVLMGHEGLLRELSNVDLARAEIYAKAFSGNDGRWLNRFLRDEAQAGVLTEWRSLLQEMPLIHVIGSGAGRFHVAHAELMGEDVDWCDLTLDQPDAEDNPLWDDPRDIWGFDMTGDGVDHVMWGRELRARVVEDDVPDMLGLSRTYVGHTITVMPDPCREQSCSRLLMASSHVFLDTGAYQAATKADRNMGLTLWCHQEDCGWKYNGEKIGDARIAY